MLPALDDAPGTGLCSRHWTMLPALDYAPGTGLCSRHWTMLPALDYAPGTGLCSRHWTMLPALDYAPGTGLCSRHWSMLPALDYAPGTGLRSSTSCTCTQRTRVECEEIQISNIDSNTYFMCNRDVKTITLFWSGIFRHTIKKFTTNKINNIIIIYSEIKCT